MQCVGHFHTSPVPSSCSGLRVFLVVCDLLIVDRFLDESGSALALPHQFSLSTCSGKEPLKINDKGLCMPDMISIALNEAPSTDPNYGKPPTGLSLSLSTIGLPGLLNDGGVALTDRQRAKLEEASTH